MEEKIPPVELQKYLSGVDYPASKDQLIQAAQDNDADQEVFDTLNNLPDKEYESPAEVSMEMGNA
ncbi:MAG: hypothetical protein ACD_9C00221G0005 [uncultured bacterium]|nr:MAG: hypothetical protein ACD_9C00221G0005 [uncultured bacterium]